MYFSTLNSNMILELLTTHSFWVTEYFKMQFELIWFSFVTLLVWFKYGLRTVYFQHSVDTKTLS
jgi:hypothetical protein